MRKAFKITGFVGSAALTAGLLGLAASATGAYFSDTETGEISATVGTIAISAPETDGTIVELLPGVTRSFSVDYTNDGVSPQDVYVTMTDEHFVALQHEGDFTINGVTVTDSTPLKVKSKLAPGASGVVTFQYTLHTDLEDQALYIAMFESGSISYEITATQVGIAPGA